MLKINFKKESTIAIMKTKDQSLGATMNDLVNIVSPHWSVPSENLDEVFPGIFIGDE